ncbi:MAG: MBOAT family O-acyltransferase [Bacteroidota bacterium]
MMNFSLNDFLNALLYQPDSPLVFQSVTFFVLFAFFYLIYAIGFKNRSFRNVWLLLFSLYFYYKISGFFVILLIGIASIDFLVGLLMHRTKKPGVKGLMLMISLVANLGALFYFKYTNFLIETWTGITSPGIQPVLLDIIQPLGISYFVFKTLTYTIDLHREMIDTPEKNWFRYLLYVSFFPNILSGPISKARDLLPQIAGAVVIDRERMSKGFFLIALGLIKKIAVADFIAANLADRVFESPQYFTGVDALMASYASLLQLFFDFSGYTDIVIGLALLMGFVVEPNFNKPFLAGNITEFWRRWHITLYNWLSEYVYQPLAFTWRRLKKPGILLAVFITFFISGLWHGAAITFVIWGLLHGTAIAWDTISSPLRTRIKKFTPGFLYKFISIFITFHFLVFTSVLLKSFSLEKAQVVYSMMLNDLDFSLMPQWLEIYSWPFIVMAVALFLQYLPIKFYDFGLRVFRSTHWILKAVLLAILFVLLYQLYNSEAMPFIYIVY